MKKILYCSALIVLSLVYSSADASGDAIEIKPSDSIYIAAVNGLKPIEIQAVPLIENADISLAENAVHVAIKLAKPTAAWLIRKDTPIEVDVGRFAAYFKAKAKNSRGKRIEIINVDAVTEVSLGQVSLVPTFRIFLTVYSRGRQVRVSGFGEGPICMRDRDEYPIGGDNFTRSTRIAFMRAFIRALLKAAQIGGLDQNSDLGHGEESPGTGVPSIQSEH